DQRIKQLGERREIEAHALVALEAAAIVARALLRVGEDGVGLRNLLEVGLGVGIVGVLIGVILERELAVRLLQARGVGVTGNAEHFVVVALQSLPPPLPEAWAYMASPIFCATDSKLACAWRSSPTLVPPSAFFAVSISRLTASRSICGKRWPY